MAPENKPLDGSIALTYNFPMYSTFMTSMTNNKEDGWIAKCNRKYRKVTK